MKLEEDKVRSTVVFLGPSLPRQTAQSVMVADYRPPVRKGDIYGLLTCGVKRIIIIDGIFHNTPSVWQREILAALDQGIEVVGASSMGALRAAELHRFGMKGFGTIFEWYRDGQLDGDDEVALHHDSEEYGYRSFSEPLVNIRYTLRNAVAEGKLTPEEERLLVAHMKAMFYPGRSYRSLLETPLIQSWTTGRRADFQSYIHSGSINLKAQDARHTLEYCARTPIGSLRPPASRTDPWSAEFRRDCLRFRAVRPLPEGSKQMDDIRRNVITRWFLADWARLRGLRCPESYTEAFTSRWKGASGLTLREHLDILAERALVSWLRDSGPNAFGLAEQYQAAGLEELLTGRGAVPIRASDQAFLSAWARENGVACPKLQRSRLLASWGLSAASERREVTEILGLNPRSFRHAIADSVTAAWLVAAGPIPFGYLFDLEVAIVQEFQFSNGQPE